MFPVERQGDFLLRAEVRSIGLPSRGLNVLVDEVAGQRTMHLCLRLQLWVLCPIILDSFVLAFGA